MRPPSAVCSTYTSARRCPRQAVLTLEVQSGDGVLRLALPGLVERHAAQVRARLAPLERVTQRGDGRPRARRLRLADVLLAGVRRQVLRACVWRSGHVRVRSGAGQGPGKSGSDQGQGQARSGQVRTRSGQVSSGSG